MTKNIKFFFFSFLISSLFFGGVNVGGGELENFFYTSFYQPPPQVFLAQISSNVFQEKEPPEIFAASALSVKVYKNGNQKIIFEKNSNQTWPIASLAKLMAAFVAMENYDLSRQLEVSKEAIGQPEDFGQLKVGESLSVENLLYLAIIESSNDAAFTLAEPIGTEAFADLMNLEAKHFGLQNTNFVDPTGYAPETYSTAKDLVTLSKYFMEQRPEIFKISSLAEFDLYTPDGVFHHKLSNTNELLNEYQEIVGGKTGYTNEAGGCLILILKNSKDGSIFINVILGAVNRFEEMKKLIEYAL